MTRQVRVIGIGAGSPDFVTQQAISALNEVDVFLVADKGETKDELVALRRLICETFIRPDHPYRLITVPDPRRGQDGGYEAGVRDWHAARAAAYASVIAGLPEDAVIGFLVWGDPAFYDSTIRIVETIGQSIPLDMVVIPGISAFQALAAAHGVVLHAVGEPVHVTTGRRLVGEYTAAREAGMDLGTIVVMLDGHLTCRELPSDADDLIIHWGAYLALPQQALLSGPLREVIDEVAALRAALRKRHGWIMDVYSISPIIIPTSDVLLDRYVRAIE